MSTSCTVPSTSIEMRMFCRIISGIHALLFLIEAGSAYDGETIRSHMAEIA